jgi:gluconate 5-dehydrogenase
MKLNDLFKLTGKVALITGGGRGIGKFIATGLAEAGADLIITSRKMKNLEATAREIEKECGVKVFPVEGDIAKEASIDNLLRKAAEKFPRIDILVNNAGVTWGAPTLEFPLEKWDYVFNTNVRGLWILTQKVSRLMRTQGGGNIINISSIYGFRGSLETHPAVPYNSTKGAVNLLTMNLAVKLAPYNIRVNAIAPGLFRTDINLYLEKPQNKELLASKLDWIPLRRMADVDDMKGAAVFLASEASAFITGHVLVVDGGFLAR